MLSLEPANRYLADTLRDKYIKPSSLDQSFVDFDSVRYHLSTPDKKTVLLLSIDIPCYAELAAYGARELLEREYPGLLLADPEDGYSVSLQLDLEQVPQDDEARAELFTKLSLLKRNALAAPFERAFRLHEDLVANPVEEGVTNDPRTAVMAIHYRPEEAIYLKPSNDRVTVIFSTVFKEETDRVLGRVFLQEFVDARRRPSCQTAPQVLYSNRDPPSELSGVKNLSTAQGVGYVTFVLFERHFKTPEIEAATITHIQLFRDYLHYMVKCSKAYLHSRLRTRTTQFLKVLNRAKPEKDDEEGKTRKTASGRTFVQ
ncbi:hypothetical protein JCM8097_006294 [Rhodosporidiobolus ruineniae]